MNRKWLFTLLMFVWLTVGYAVVHIVIMVWSMSLINAIWPDSAPIEQLVVTKEGEPLIQSYANGFTQISFRRLDGTLVPDTLGIQKNFLGPTYLGWGVDSVPTNWHSRLTSFHDFQRPATCWYLIVPPDYGGAAYFVGYDHLSRRLVGYIGVDGLSSQRPDIGQSFPINMKRYSAFSGSLAATQMPHVYGSTWEPDGDSIELQYAHMVNAAPDVVWILSRGIIYEISLGARTVSKLVKDRPEMRMLARANSVRDEKSYLELRVRTDDGMLVIDPKTGDLTSLPLEPVPSNYYELLYQTTDGQRLLIYQQAETPHGELAHNILLWLDEGGKVERRAETRIHRQSSLMFSNPDVALALCLPSPIVSYCGWFVVPFVISDDLPVKGTIPERFFNFLSSFKVWLVLSSLAGIGAGWACRRREVDVFDRANWFWPILVGLCGWFGWVGYCFLRPLPARLPNRDWLPSQPEPARPLGTEIFA